MKIRFAQILILLIAALLCLMACSDDDGTSTPSITEIQIGALTPQSGSYSDQGAEILAAIDLAVEDLNADFASQGLNYEVAVISSDTQTDPAIATALMNSYLEQNFRFIIGPMTSAEVAIVSEAVNASQSLLISPSSTMVDLSIADDNIIRLVPDDSRLAEATVQAMLHNGITHLAILYHDNMWGLSLATRMCEAFEAQGGTIIDTVQFIGTRTSEIAGSLEELSASMNNYLASGNTNEAAIQMISFDSGSIVLDIAASDTTLEKVRWYGSDGYVNNNALFDGFDEGAAFAANVQFTSPIFGIETTSESISLAARIEQVTGNAPGVYSMLAYDAVVSAAKVLQADGQQASFETLYQDVVQVMADNPGVTGDIDLNDAGDRSDGRYCFWTVINDNGTYEWVHSMTYNDGVITEE